MRPSGRRSVAIVAGALLTLSLAQGAFAAGAAGPTDGMAIMRVRGAHGHGPGGGGGGSNPNLYSHGGSIEAVPKVYISYWGTEWSNSTYAAAQAYVGGFFGNVGGSPWINSTHQYCDGVTTGTYTCPSGADVITNPSGQLAGTWNDTTAVPSKPSQSDIAAAAARLAQQETGGPVAGATYFVFTPSGKSMSGFGTRWCAWHSSSGSMAYAYMPYIPDAGASCGMNFVNSGTAGYFDGFSIVGGHEYAEAQTDPYPSTGWLDGSGSENGDKCAWTLGPSGDITLPDHNAYAVQSLWSNAANSGKGGCVLSYP